MHVENVFVTNPLRPHVSGYFALGEQPRGLIKYLVDRFHPSTVLDVGSGPFASKKIFEQFGCRYVWCLDGDSQLLDRADLIEHLVTFSVVDLERSGYRFPTRFDMVFSYEVAEHIANVDNYIYTLTENCENTIVMTAALPGSGGHHHVSEHPNEFWIKKITETGKFRYLGKESLEGRATGDGYFSRSGMIFQRIK
jgi:hypothetical protein